MSLASTLLLLLLPLACIADPSCTPPDSNGQVTCTIVGPAQGSFVFPVGVSSFSLVTLTSGNGGFSNNSLAWLFESGYGAQIGPFASFSIPSNGYSLPYMVGGNGANGTFGPSVNVGPPYAGTGYGYSSSGGGPSYLSDQNIYLGGGGGGSSGFYGGNAGAGCAPQTYCAGQDGQPGAFNGQGYGAPAQAGSWGQGGYYSSTGSIYPQSARGQPGDPTGRGGDGWRPDLSVALSYRGGDDSSFYAGAGGGGGITGAGGGGSFGGSGGGGNSFSGVPGLAISQRQDFDLPRLVFTYTMNPQKTPTVTAGSHTLASTGTIQTRTSTVATGTTQTRSPAATTSLLFTSTSTQTGPSATPTSSSGTGWSCTSPNPLRVVTCSVSGPSSGTFSFPPGVSSFQILDFSSGNGGDGNGTAYYNYGGNGAQLVGYSNIAIPASGYQMPYFVGQNGAPGTSGTQANVAPMYAGTGYGGSGSGGGPSFLPDQNIYLGGGGGAGESAIGGDAGAGCSSNVYCAGKDGQTCSPPGTGGQGAPGFLGVSGQGGFYDPTNSTQYDGYSRAAGGQSGDAGGKGGDGWQIQAEDMVLGVNGWISDCGAGGGAGLTGAGGGGGFCGAGGGGNSFCGAPGFQIVARGSYDAPRLVISFQLAENSTSLVIPSQTATSTPPNPSQSMNPFCSLSNSLSVVLCTITGPAQGRFEFPPSVTEFVINDFTSGNGGRGNNSLFWATVSPDDYTSYGTGAQLLGNRPIAIPPSYSMPYFVGANGVPGTSGLNANVAPNGGGNSYGPCGTGGSPSYLPDQQIWLGAGGGASPLGLTVIGSVGGSAGTNCTAQSYCAGQSGYSSSTDNAATVATQGQGAPAQAYSNGNGGTYDQFYNGGSTPEVVNGSPGQLGKGGDGWLPPLPSADNGYADYSIYCGGGGGGGMTGSGGGGAYTGSGGAGNSYNGQAGYRIASRGDSAPPRLVFAYRLPVSVTATSTQTVSVSSRTTLAASTSTLSVLRRLTKMTTISSTTQDPVSQTSKALTKTLIRTSVVPGSTLTTNSTRLATATSTVTKQSSRPASTSTSTVYSEAGASVFSRMLTLTRTIFATVASVPSVTTRTTLLTAHLVKTSTLTQPRTSTVLVTSSKTEAGMTLTTTATTTQTMYSTTAPRVLLAAHADSFVEDTSTASDDCVVYLLSYPDGCCPAVFEPNMVRLSAAPPGGELSVLRRQRRQLVSGVTLTVATTTVTTTTSLISTVAASASKLTVTQTTYTPTVTQTSFFEKPASTRTVTGTSFITTTTLISGTKAIATRTVTVTRGTATVTSLSTVNTSRTNIVTITRTTTDPAVTRSLTTTSVVTASPSIPTFISTQVITSTVLGSDSSIVVQTLTVQASPIRSTVTFEVSGTKRTTTLLTTVTKVVPVSASPSASSSSTRSSSAVSTSTRTLSPSTSSVLQSTTLRPTTTSSALTTSSSLRTSTMTKVMLAAVAAPRPTLGTAQSTCTVRDMLSTLTCPDEAIGGSRSVFARDAAAEIQFWKDRSGGQTVLVKCGTVTYAA